MNLKNTVNKKYLIILAVFFFTLIRSFVFANEELIGYNFSKKEVTFDSHSAIFIVLIVLYSIVNANLVLCIYKKLNNYSWLPCILLIADTTFLIAQIHPVVLIIRILWTICFNSFISEKSISKNILQPIFLFLASILSPETALGFIPLVALVEFVPDINKNKKEKKSVVSLISSSAAIAIGVTGHYILSANNSAFKNLIDFLNPSKFVEKDKILAVLLLSIPSLLVSAYFLYIYLNKFKKTQKSNHKSSPKKTKATTLLNIIYSVFVLLIVGSVFGGYETISTLSLFAPVIILMLVYSDYENATLSLKDIDSTIFKYPVASIATFITVNYLSLRFYLWGFGVSIVANFFIWNK